MTPATKCEHGFAVDRCDRCWSPATKPASPAFKRRSRPQSDGSLAGAIADAIRWIETSEQGGDGQSIMPDKLRAALPRAEAADALAAECEATIAQSPTHPRFDDLRAALRRYRGQA